jgi:hypothetical protein
LLGAPIQPEVPLGAHRIRLAKPIPELGIDLLGRSQTEVMHVVPPGYGVDPTKARMRHAAGKDKMAVQPAMARRDLKKGHPHLEGDSRLLA